MATTKASFEKVGYQVFLEGHVARAADDCKILEEHVEKLFFKGNAKLIIRIDFLWGQRKSLGMMGRKNEEFLSIRIA